MHNNLFLNRLIIYTNSGDVAYDEHFHRGVNIIRGANSSGKSTITHFIFYVLGGAFNDWVKEARKCAYVIAEVELNGATIVLKREININSHTGKANAQEPMYIFWGSLAEYEINNLDSNWHKYGYQTHSDTKSFSNIIFENLNIPIVKGENNITFHQLLRLIYIDQESPTNSLFLYEQFDSSFTRETISELLLGVYNQELYDNKQRKIEVDRCLDEIKRERKVIKKFIKDPNDLDPAFIYNRIENKKKEISNIEDSIMSLKEEEKNVRYTKKTKLDFIKLNEDSIKQREKVAKLDSDIRSSEFEIEDSKFFIESLLKKIKALNNSIITREFLGEFPLEYCPECLSEISNNDVNTCKLCKQNIDESYGVTQARKLEQELSFQLNESSYLLEIKERKLIDLKASLEVEKVELYQIQKKVNQSMKDVRSVRDEKIDTLYSNIGFIDGEIVQLKTLLENASLFQALTSKENEISKEQDYLKRTIEDLIKSQERRMLRINQSIENKGLFLLNNDLRRQQDFAEAHDFNIDYRNNMAFISDKDAKYSASSNFYLKTSARFSLFLASLDNDEMRYPRFVFCDNMEDKGIEKERAQNFQRIIIEQAEKTNSNEFQLIYTTSFIPEDLDNTEYCVGESYTESNPSLKNV